jgi:hypothetical protein
MIVWALLAIPFIIPLSLAALNSLAAYRELDPESGCFVPFQNESPNQVVETRPKMMDNFTDENRKTQGNFLTKGDEIARHRIGIDVTNDTIVIRTDKAGNLGFEILDVLVGPLNLRPTPIK